MARAGGGLTALDDDALRQALSGLGIAASDQLVRLAHGSAGRALSLAESDDEGMTEQLGEILDGLPRTQARQMLAFAERYGRRERDQAFQLARGIILDWIQAHVRGLAAGGARPGVLAPWSEVWEKVEHAFAQADILNLDRTQTFLGVFQALGECAAGEARASASTPA